MKTKCKHADKYKGKYPPRCRMQDDQPCDVCMDKWIDTLDGRLTLALEKLEKKDG